MNKKETYGVLTTGAGTIDETKRNIVGVVELELKDRILHLSEIDDGSYLISTKPLNGSDLAITEMWVSEVTLHGILALILSLFSSTGVDENDSIELLKKSGLKHIKLTENYTPPEGESEQS